MGQADAGQMSGGNCSLQGGFWDMIAAKQTEGAPYLRAIRTEAHTVCFWWAVPETSWHLQAATNLIEPGTNQPGDLLTTCSLPGRAMKVADYARAHGAIFGKAMSRLESGRGLVLVLVTLQ